MIPTTIINRRIMLPELEFPQAVVAQVGYAARCDSPNQENDEQDDNDDADNDDAENDDDDDDDDNDDHDDDDGDSNNGDDGHGESDCLREIFRDSEYSHHKEGRLTFINWMDWK